MSPNEENKAPIIPIYPPSPMTGYAVTKGIMHRDNDPLPNGFVKLLGVDFDNTVTVSQGTFVRGFRNNVRESLKALKNSGLYILIHTARVSSFWNNEPTHEAVSLAEFLNDNEIPWDGIWIGTGKPPVWRGIDDHIFQFRDNENGNGWEEALKQISQALKV